MQPLHATEWFPLQSAPAPRKRGRADGWAALPSPGLGSPVRKQAVQQFLASSISFPGLEHKTTITGLLGVQQLYS